MESKRLAPLSTEFSNAKLGDGRLTARLKVIADCLAALPSAGFPEQANSTAELEAIYRFFDNDNVSAEAVLDAHVQRTVERAEAYERVLVLHDTSEFKFGGEQHREGLSAARHCGNWRSHQK